MLNAQQFQAQAISAVSNISDFAADSSNANTTVSQIVVVEQGNIRVEQTEATQATGLFCDIDQGSIALQAREAIAEQQGIDLDADGFDVDAWVEDNSEALNALEAEYLENAGSAWLSDEAYARYQESVERMISGI